MSFGACDACAYGDVTTANVFEPGFYRALQRAFRRVEAQGWSPHIASGWRSPEEQQAHFKAGRSQVEFSFHNAVTEQGAPAALAADVIDARYGWGAGGHEAEAAAFWKALGAAVEAEGLVWGGRWRQSNPTWAKYGLSWDPGHVQAYDNTLLSKVRRRAEMAGKAVAAGDAKAFTQQMLTLPAAVGRTLKARPVLAGGLVLGSVLLFGLAWAFARRAASRS